MKLAIPKERRHHETRVAASPETVKKLVGLGFEVAVERDAGAAALIPNDQFKDAGATIADDLAAVLDGADVVFKVQRPLTGQEGDPDELGPVKEGAMLVGMLAPYADRAIIDAYAEKKVDAFSLELAPRITRAQAMDVLSSQANLAGYKAVLDGASEFGRVFPMMMTAAGTVPPARVLILGAGVAGLQAIATARRMGAIVSATDVRQAAGEEVRSLGATFLEPEMEEVEDGQTEGGYAKEMSEEYRKKQAALVSQALTKTDIAICTALILGKPAPRLISADQVKSMKPGAVIVDLAAAQGGNCELCEVGKVAVKHDVTIVGHENVPARLPLAASMLYAKNLLNFIMPLVDAETKSLKVDWEDEIVNGTALTRGGAVVHPSFMGKGE